MSVRLTETLAKQTSRVRYTLFRPVDSLSSIWLAVHPCNQPFLRITLSSSFFSKEMCTGQQGL